MEATKRQLTLPLTVHQNATGFACTVALGPKNSQDLERRRR